MTNATVDRFLSSRVTSLSPSSTLAVSARIKALRASGLDVIGFGAGEPDFDTPEQITDAAIRALRAGDTHYAPTPGTMAARQAIADKLRNENGIDCGPEHVVISNGAKQSLYMIMQCLIEPGADQEVILLTPAWVSYRAAVELAGGVVVELPGAIARSFKVTAEELAEVLTSRTRAIIINSPSNPTGATYSEAELRAMADVLAGHPGVTIISDEIYEKLVFGTIEPFSIGSLPALAERTVTVNGMSKAFAMTGWRVGYAAAPGDGLAHAMSSLQSQMTSCITSFCYPSIITALEHGAEDVERMRCVFDQRAGLIHELVNAWPDVQCPRPAGAFYVFPKIDAHFGKSTPGGRAIDSAGSFADALLEEARVGVVPGDDFGEIAKAHIRLGFATDEATIREGCERIEAFLRSLR